MISLFKELFASETIAVYVFGFPPSLVFNFQTEDEEFAADEEEEIDVEETIEEQEKHEKKQDIKQELDDLKNEGTALNNNVW